MSVRTANRPVPVPHHSLLAATTFEAAEQEVSAALAVARADGDAETSTQLETWRGLVRARRGHLAGALADLELAATRVAGTGGATAVAAHAGLLDCHLARGDLWRAGRFVRPLERAGTVDGIPGALAHQARGDVAGAQRDHAAAWQHHLDAGRALGPLVDRPAVLPWRLGAAVAAVHLGLRKDATALIETHGVLAGADGRDSVVAAALRAQAAISEAGTRRDLLERALLHADPVDAPRLTSQVATDLASHLVLGRGSTERARTLLRAAESLARACGLRPAAARAGRLLLLLGETPCSPPATRADDLTALQLLLARGAAEGRTDEELAVTLLLDGDVVRRELREACRALNVRVRHRIGHALRLPAAC